SRYCRKGDTKVTSYFSYRIKNLRLFVLICYGDATQNLKQLRTLVLLCLKGQACWKASKASHYFLSGHNERIVRGRDRGRLGAENNVTGDLRFFLPRFTFHHRSMKFAGRSFRKSSEIFYKRIANLWNNVDGNCCGALR